MNNKYGFTLVELVIVIVVVGILAVVAVPVYRGYVKRGIATEGKNLLGEINAAQQSYYYRFGKFYQAAAADEQYNTGFGVDARKNKYFTSYTKISVNDTNGTFVYRTNQYKGYALTITGSLTTTPEIKDDFTNNAI